MCLAISLNFRRYLEPKWPELEGNSSPQRPANFFFTGHSTPVALWRNTCQWRSNPLEGASYPHHFVSLSASQIKRILFKRRPRDSRNPRDRGKRRDARNRESSWPRGRSMESWTRTRSCPDKVARSRSLITPEMFRWKLRGELAPQPTETRRFLLVEFFNVLRKLAELRRRI